MPNDHMEGKASILWRTVSDVEIRSSFNANYLNYLSTYHRFIPFLNSSFDGVI
jgi:hypothetical protein